MSSCRTKVSRLSKNSKYDFCKSVLVFVHKTKQNWCLVTPSSPKWSNRLSVTHWQCDARPTVTFPAAQRHRLLTDTMLHCLTAGAQRREQLAQSGFKPRRAPGVEPATSWSQVRRPTRCATAPLHSAGAAAEIASDRKELKYYPLQLVVALETLGSLNSTGFRLFARDRRIGRSASDLTLVSVLLSVLLRRL